MEIVIMIEFQLIYLVFVLYKYWEMLEGFNDCLYVLVVEDVLVSCIQDVSDGCNVGDQINYLGYLCYNFLMDWQDLVIVVLVQMVVVVVREYL